MSEIENYGKCTNCDTDIEKLNNLCPTCGETLGYPNVMLADMQSENEALTERFTQARNKSLSDGILKEFDDLVTEVNDKSSVVVAMPVNVALNIVTDDSNQYVNYEKLVGSGSRGPASFSNDSHRNVVAGKLFGSFGSNIVYGALSLSHRGLGTYGDIFCKMRPIAIERRTSFLEVNSYDFLKKYDTVRLPKGFKSTWSTRSTLAAVKLLNSRLLKKNQTIEEWDRRILVTDNKNREKDEFIEAHIFGSFNKNSIESVSINDDISDKNDVQLAKIIVDAF